MNKNTIAKAFVLMVLLILLSFSIRASIFATIGMKGLSFASPQAAGVVQNVMKAYQITTDPSGFITGEITGKITGEIMGKIAEQSPEAAKAIQQYQQVQGWIDEGAKISEDLKLDDKGQFVGGSFTTAGEGMKDYTSMISADMQKNGGSVKASEGITFSSQGEGENVKAEFKDGGVLTLDGKKFPVEKTDPPGFVELDREGELAKTDITLSEDTTIDVGGTQIVLQKGTRLVYDKEKGIFEVHGKDKTVEIGDRKIQINGDNYIKQDVKSGVITGKDFTIDDKRFTGVGNNLAEMTSLDEGYLLGKNTQMEDDRMIITSEKGNTLYSTMCGDVSGFNNYANPCSKKLTAEGDGFLVRLKEGKQFGLNIEKDDVFEYQLKGGKVTLDNGQQTMDLPEGKSVVVKNGNVETTYTKLEGIDQELIGWENIDDFDVSTSSVYADGTMGNTINEETSVETVYAQCSDSPTGGVIANKVSGMITFKEYCSAVGINTKHPLQGRYWGDKKDDIKITGVSKVIDYPDGTHSMFIQTKESGVEQWYSISSNGQIYQYNQQTGKWTLTEDKVEVGSIINDFKMGATVASSPPPSREPSKETGATAAAENLGKKVTESVAGGPAAVYFKGIGTGNKIRLEGYDEYFIRTGEGIYESQISGDRFQEYPKGSGKYVKVP